jgi:hypothetical protein
MRTLALALGMTLLFVSYLPAAPPAQPVLTYREGDVTAKPSKGEWVKAAVGMAFAGGDQVKTGSRAKAEISFPSGAMRLYENTLVVIPSLADRAGKKDIALVGLEQGSALFRIDPAAGTGFSVKTRHVTAGVKGTSFAGTAEEEESQVIVYFGRVEVVSAAGGPAVELHANQSITGDANGLGIPTSGFNGDGWNGWNSNEAPQSEASPAGEASGDGFGRGPTDGLPQ